MGGYATALLKISGDQSLKHRQFNTANDLNHAASIQFGRLVERHWKFMSEEQASKITVQGFEYIVLQESDKQCVRENIMAAIFQQVSNRPITK